MDTLAILDIVASVDVDEVTELYSQVIARDLVHLNTTLLHIVRTEADKDCISTLLPTAKTIRKPKGTSVHFLTE